MCRCRTTSSSRSSPSPTSPRSWRRAGRSSTSADAMATKVVMEALSPTMEEGRIASWKKKEGDAVKSAEVIAEVETDKAVMDLVARGDGVLKNIVVKEGQTVPVGDLLAMIGGADEDVSAPASTA